VTRRHPEGDRTVNIRSLGYVGVASPRAKEFETFGPDVLGTPLWTEPKDGVYLRLDERAYRIAVHPGERDQLRYIGWEVAGPAALDDAVASLTRWKVEAHPASTQECAARHVEGMAWFLDPWGQRHEIFYGQRALLSFRPTRDIAGFVTGELGLGHVVLVAPDVREAVEFFVKVMGFRVSDFIDVPFPLAFFHANPRHHSLAVGQAGPLRGLHHIMLEVKDMNDVGTTYELCRERGLKFAMDLGRHSNDKMFSFYVRTPGGFEIEYGWGGLLIDDATWQVKRLSAPSFWGHRHSPDLPPPSTISPVEDLRAGS
jgi:extradiol dioxygenase